MSRSFTMSTVNRGAAISTLRQYQRGARLRAEVVVVSSLERMVNSVAAFCPYDVQQLDDFHMVEHIESRISPGGLSYEVGFSEATFAEFGQPPYFIYTEFGTTKMDAQPCVFPARDLEAPRFRRELAAALAPRSSEGGSP
jgi:hypothetical protein